MSRCLRKVGAAAVAAEQDNEDTVGTGKECKAQLVGMGMAVVRAAQPWSWWYQ